MMIDGLPAWGNVGIAGDDTGADTESGRDHEKTDASIYTHHAFEISYNEDRIIQVQYTPLRPVQIYDGEN
jgi:hypothetical protein